VKNAISQAGAAFGAMVIGGLSSIGPRCTKPVQITARHFALQHRCATFWRGAGGVAMSYYPRMHGQKRHDWRRFWWHPIFGPLLPMGIIIGLVIVVIDFLEVPLQ
jgi:hypothetical protein